MDAETKNLLLIECEKLKSFLDHNQLVQANAVTKRIQGKLHDVVALDTRESKAPVEGHPLWRAFRKTFAVESRILSGNAIEALKEAESISVMMR